MPRRTFLRRSQIAEGLSRTQGAIGIKVDQHVVHDDRQCGGLRRVVADMREPQGQIELFLRAPAQHFGADRFAVRREDAQRTVFQRGSNADPRAARNGGKQRGGRTDDAGLSFFFEPPARFKQQMPGQRVPAPFQTQAPYGPGKRRSPKAQTGKRFRALGLLQTDFLRTQGIGKPLLFVRKHGQAAREACELRFQDLFVRLAERGEKRRNIGIRPIQIPSRQTQGILQIFAAALERFPFQLCPVPPIKRLGIGHLRHIEETFHFPHGVMMDGLSLPDFHGLFFGSGAETHNLGVFGTGGLPFAQQRFQASGPIRLFRCVVRAGIRQTAKLPQDIPKRHTEGIAFAFLPLQLLVKPQALRFQRLYAIHPLQRFPGRRRRQSGCQTKPTQKTFPCRIRCNLPGTSRLKSVFRSQTGLFQARQLEGHGLNRLFQASPLVAQPIGLTTQIQRVPRRLGGPYIIIPGVKGLGKQRAHALRQGGAIRLQRRQFPALG